PEQVGVEDAQDLRLGHGLEPAPPAPASVVDQDVDPVEVMEREADEPSCLAGPADVRLSNEHLGGAGLAALVGDSLEAVEAASAQRQTGPAAGEGDRGGRSDAARSPGD